MIPLVDGLDKIMNFSFLECYYSKKNCRQILICPIESSRAATTTTTRTKTKKNRLHQQLHSTHPVLFCFFVNTTSCQNSAFFFTAFCWKQSIINNIPNKATSDCRETVRSYDTITTTTIWIYLPFLKALG